MIAKALCAVLAVLFAASAAVQLNDPDPVVWVILYALAAANLAMGGLGRFNLPLIWGTGLACAAGFLYLSPSVVELLAHHRLSLLAGPMSPDQPFIEEARESLGMLLAVLALVFVYVLARRASARARA